MALIGMELIRPAMTGKSTMDRVTPMPIFTSVGTTSPPRNGERTSTGRMRHINKPTANSTSEKLSFVPNCASTSSRCMRRSVDQRGELVEHAEGELEQLGADPG